MRLDNVKEGSQISNIRKLNFKQNGIKPNKIKKP